MQSAKKASQVKVPGKGTRRASTHTRQMPGRGTRVSEVSASKPRWTWLKCAVAGEGKVQLHLFKPNIAISKLKQPHHAHFSEGDRFHLVQTWIFRMG